MANGRPWNFDSSIVNARKASKAQEEAEKALRQAYADAGAAQESYRMALAEQILELRAEGMAATLCQEVAKGTKHVAALRREWDIAEGVKEAMVQAAWRKTADRKDVQSFILWSRRKDEEEDRIGESIP